MASEETRKRVVQTRYWKELRRMLQDCGGIVQENGLNIAKIAAGKTRKKKPRGKKRKGKR